MLVLLVPLDLLQSLAGPLLLLLRLLLRLRGVPPGNARGNAVVLSQLAHHLLATAAGAHPRSWHGREA